MTPATIPLALGALLRVELVEGRLLLRECGSGRETRIEVPGDVLGELAEAIAAARMELTWQETHPAQGERALREAVTQARACLASAATNSVSIFACAQVLGRALEAAPEAPAPLREEAKVVLARVPAIFWKRSGGGGAG